MPVKVNPSSYLQFSDFVNVAGIEFWRLPEFPDIFPQDDDLYIKIGQGGPGQLTTQDESLRIDLLSYRIYNTPQLWWVIALRNNFEVVPSEFKSGAIIVAPSSRYVFQEILPQARR